MGAFLYYGAALLGLFLIQKLLFFAWWNPRKIEKNLNAQGIKGPPYRFLFGNLKDLAKIYRDPSSWIVPSKRKTTHPTLQQALPHYQKWRDEYGKIYLYWFGPRPRVVINDPELAKEIMGNLRLFPKSLPHPAIFQMVGHSLIASEGDRWTGRRKFMNPFFNIESLKDLAPTVVRCTKDMLENWNNLIGKSSEKEIEVFAQFQSLTKDFIARALCGDGDCDEARRIFEHQAEQIHLVADALRMFYITGTRFLPTPFNIKSWIVNRRINKMFMDLLWKRYKTGGRDGLLGSVLSANEKDKSLTDQDIIDECKTMFVGGYETTALFLSWTCVLLGTHTEWQEKARKEVEDVLQGKPPTPDSLSRLKTVSMILNESMRIFAPAPVIARKVNEPTKLGNYEIPAGTQLDLPILGIHNDPEQWGDDAGEFNPNRFANGVSKASKHPMALMPFSIGPRICIGMNLAMIEAKLALAVVLQNFSFVLSPSYKHAPNRGITLLPSHGVHIMVKRI